MSATIDYSKLSASAKVNVASQDDNANLPRFLTVKQASQLLHINEKKIYALASEGRIPATKITGKWLFPLNLIEQWLVENSHQGTMADRLLIGGSDDALLHRVIGAMADRLGDQALIQYSPTDTRSGLALLDKNRIDVCLIHWGPSTHATIRHLALISRYRSHAQWVLVRLVRRTQGLLYAGTNKFDGAQLRNYLSSADIKWAKRGDGSSSQRLINELCINNGLDPETPRYVRIEHSERAAAASIVCNSADITAGSEAVAREFGLGFLPLSEEAIDAVVSRKTYFRTLFQNLLEQFTHGKSTEIAKDLAGYQFVETGQVFTIEDQ